MTGTDDQLRTRLSAIDPLHPTTTPEPLARYRAEEILEHAMGTITDTTLTPAAPAPRTRRFRAPLLAAAAVLAVAAAAGVAVVMTDGDADPGGSSTLSLSVGSGDAMSSCLQFDVAILAGMPIAFAGTATEISADAVTIEVDRWYRGGDADVVSVSVPDGQTSAALDGVSFQAGTRYLVTATDGVVNGCGFSGEASPEFEAAYAEAFAG